MAAGYSVAADSELPKLKQLASGLLATDLPELSILDDIAALAAAIAARTREAAEAARVQLLEAVKQNAGAVFATTTDELHGRLTQAGLEELSGLGALLDQAVAAASAFREADISLMAAREQGDYAAMAPLAIEADTQKKALTSAGAEFANRLGLGDALTPAALAPKPAAAPDPAPAVEVSPSPPAAAAPEPASTIVLPTTVAEADGVADASEARADELPDLDRPADGQPERRRLRALIRQMRPADAP